MHSKIADTITAIKGGLTKLPIKAAVSNIEMWETALEKVAGSDALVKDLGALKKGLQMPSIDAKAMTTLLHKIGTETTTLAAKAPADSGKELKSLGTMLSGVGH